MTILQYYFCLNPHLALYNFISTFRVPDPEPLRHNVSNYLHMAKKIDAVAKGLNEEGNANSDSMDGSNIADFLTRESEIGPEVTHIYQIENKVHNEFWSFVVTKVCIYSFPSSQDKPIYCTHSY